MYLRPRLEVGELRQSVSAYRVVAHAYFCSAYAILERFGFDSEHDGIKFVSLNKIKNHGAIILENDYMKMDEFCLMTPLPFYYLLSHSLELYLKGYLEHKKCKSRKTHNLKELMDACQKDNILFTKEEEDTIKKFHAFNNLDYHIIKLTKNEFDLKSANNSLYEGIYIIDNKSYYQVINGVINKVLIKQSKDNAVDNLANTEITTFEELRKIFKNVQAQSGFLFRYPMAFSGTPPDVSVAIRLLIKLDNILLNQHVAKIGD